MIFKGFRPMLGETVEDLYALRYPLLGSYKYDGIRALWYDGELYSRNLKPIPNRNLVGRIARALNGSKIANGLDGELIAGDPTSKHCFNTTTSSVMTKRNNPTATHIRYYVFDHFGVTGDFEKRIDLLKPVFGVIEVVQQKLLLSLDDVMELEQKAVDLGYEGLILRDPKGRYKYGRSTLREQGLLKIKRLLDGEGTIIDAVERLTNQNPATLDALGYKERSSHQANMKPMGTLGALIVDWNGQALGIGTGFTDGERAIIWRAFQKGQLKGEVAKFKYSPTTKELPRHPVFLGFRDRNDL